MSGRPEDGPFLFLLQLATAANFRLILNVAIFLKRKCYAIMKTEFVLIS